MEAVTPRCRTRLRRACDGCSVAKVKCDRKDLAACDRCQLNEMECTFSVSRRYGKQSWAKRVASQWGTESHPQHQQHDQRAQTRGSGVGRGGSDVYLFSALDAGDVVFDGAPFWDEEGFASTYGDMTIDMDMASNEHNSLPRPLQGQEGLQFGDESKTTGASSLASVSSAASASASLSLPTSHTTPSGQDAAQSCSLPHDCEAQALAILQSLQHSLVPLPRDRHLGTGSEGGTVGYKPPVWPQLPDAAAPSPTTTAGTGTDPKPNLDQVLLVNKAALQHFTQLVGCPCAVKPHLALLYLALLAKMLFWYREAATGKATTSSRGAPRRRSELPSTTKPSGPEGHEGRGRSQAEAGLGLARSWHCQHSGRAAGDDQTSQVREIVETEQIGWMTR
ncbi:hypothetical protein PG995_009039 [Apiospora arundinis]